MPMSAVLEVGSEISHVRSELDMNSLYFSLVLVYFADFE